MSDMNTGQPVDTGFNFDAGFGGAGNGNQGSSGDQGLANDFLARIPEADREVVGRYVKDWDAGVTRRFQDLNARYEPYKNLGSYEDIVKAVQLFQYVQANPEQVYKDLHAHYGQQQGQQQSQEDEWGDLPQSVQDRLRKMDQHEQMLTALAERVIGMNNESQEAAEDRQLDEYLKALSTQYGDFDEDFVLAKMYSGMDGAQAVQEFQNRFGGGNQQQQRFSVLTGSGAVGQQGTFNPAKAPGQDVRNMVGEMLKYAQQQGQ